MIALSFGDDLFPGSSKKTTTVVSTCLVSCIISVFSFFLSSFFYRLSVYRFACVGVLAFVHSCLCSRSKDQQSQQKQQPPQKKRSNSNQCHLSCDVVHFVAMQTLHCETHTHTNAIKRDCCCCCCRLLHRISCKYA